MLFNHAAGQISIDRMDDAVALFTEHLGFGEVFRMDRPESAEPFRMSILRQPGTNVDVQLTGMMPVEPQGRKTMSQLGFVSDDARADIESVRRWCDERGLRTVVGEFGPGFLWIDLPDVFMDFILEVMDRKALLASGCSLPVEM